MLELWHLRLGHMNVKGMYTFKNMMNNMNSGKLSCLTSLLFMKHVLKVNYIGFYFIF